MKNRKHKQARKLKYLLIALSIWWTITFILATFQVYFMSRSIVFLLIGLVISALIAFAHFMIYKSLLKEKKFAKLIYLTYASIHFIPLILQIIGLRIPSIDSAITAFIGLLMIYVYD